MAKKAKAGKVDLVVREKAMELTRYLRPKDWYGQIHALFDFVQNQIRYTRDINNVETLHDAAQVLQQRQGDCDDKAILLASLLESIGHPARFVAIGFGNKGDIGEFSHVLVQTPIGNARDPKNWIWLETTEPVSMGWKPQNVTAVMKANI